MEGGDVLVGGAAWRRVRSERGLEEMGRVCVPEASLSELQERGVALARELRRAATDVIVCGDAGGLRGAARLALWARGEAPATRWIGVPCCPYNSVPFTVCSVGYASALRYCAGIVRGYVREAGEARLRVEVDGDEHGWLALGIGALCGTWGGGETLRLRLGEGMPCARFEERLGRVLGKAVVERARYAAPGVMLTVRLRGGSGAPVSEHVALTESMYAPRGIPAQYVTKVSGRPAPAMRELAQRLCAPWRPIRARRGGKHDRDE